MRLFAFFVLILFLGAAHSLTITPGSNCAFPGADCTLTFAFTTLPTINPSSEANTWFAGASFSGPCSLSGNVLTVDTTTAPNAPFTCTFSKASNTVTFVTPITLNQETADLPAKVWSSSFLTQLPDCTSESSSCTLNYQLSLPISSMTLITFASTSNFKYLSSTHGSSDFENEPFVQTAQFTISPGETVKFSAQISKEAGCRSYSFYFTSVAYGRVSFSVPNVCGVAVATTQSADCLRNNAATCQVEFGLMPGLATTTNVVITNVFDKHFYAIYSSTDGSSGNTCANAVASSNDVNIQSFPCTVIFLKHLGPNALPTLKLASSLTTLNNSPMVLSRVYTSPIIGSTFDASCADPIKVYCPNVLTLQLYDPAATVTLSSDFYTRTGVTINTPATITQTVSSSSVVLQLTAGNPPAGAGVVSSINISSVKKLREIAGTESFKATYTLRGNTQVIDIPNSPPNIQLNPINSYIVGQDCSSPETHECTISFTHPRMLTNDFNVKFTPPTGSTQTPFLPTVAPQSVNAAEYDATTGSYRVKPTRSLTSTIVLAKGNLVSDKIDISFAKINGQVFTGVNPIIEASSAQIDLKHASFMISEANCVDMTTTLCTIKITPYFSKLRLYYQKTSLRYLSNSHSINVDTSNTDYLQLSPTGSQMVPIGDQSFSFTFAGDLTATSLSIRPEITANDGITTIAFTDTAPNTVAYVYTSDPSLKFLPNCDLSTSVTCTLQISFSQVAPAVLAKFTMDGGHQIVLATNANPLCSQIILSIEQVSLDQIVSLTTPHNNGELFTNVPALLDLITPLSCPFQMTKKYGVNNMKFQLQESMNRPTTAVETHIITYLPITVQPRESCYTYPQDGTNFKCQLIFGFFGLFQSLKSQKLPDYNWILPKDVDTNCYGALGTHIAVLRFDSTSQQLILSPTIVIDMVTFCQVTIEYTAASLPNTAALDELDFTLLPTGDHILTSLPIPPPQKPVKFDYTVDANPISPIEVTITLQQSDIISFAIAEPLKAQEGLVENANTSLQCVDPTDETNIILTLNTEGTEFTIHPTAMDYTAPLSCSWLYYPTANTPTVDLLHTVQYVETVSRDTYYFTESYPQFQTVMTFTLPEGCSDVALCNFELKFHDELVLEEAYVYNFLLFTVDDPVYDCIDVEDGVTVIATVGPQLDSDTNAVRLHLLPKTHASDGTSASTTGKSCTFSIPLIQELPAAKIPLTASIHYPDDVGAYIPLTYQYNLSSPHISPKVYLSLTPTYCRVGMSCAYEFNIDSEYLKERPLFAFKSPLNVFWMAHDGNICDMQQISGTVYLRVIADLTTTKLTTHPTCTIYATPLAPLAAGRLTIQRYHPKDLEAVALTNKFALPDLSLYNPQLNTFIDNIPVYATDAVPVIAGPAAAAVPGFDMSLAPYLCNGQIFCTIGYSFILDNIRTVRMTNFFAFDTPSLTFPCLNPFTYATLGTITLSPYLEYVYLTASASHNGGVFKQGDSCVVNYPIIQTRPASSYQQSYEIVNLVGVTNDVTTTTFVAEHSVDFVPFSPFSLSVGLSRIMPAGQHSYIRYDLTRPMFSPYTPEEMLLTRAFLSFSFADNAVPKFTNDRRRFVELECYIVTKPDITVTLPPTCSAGHSIDGNIDLVYVTFGETATTDIVQGFYITFQTFFPPTSTNAEYVFFKQDSNINSSGKVPEAVILTHSNMALIHVEEYDINVWPAEYDTFPTSADEQRIFVPTGTMAFSGIPGIDITVDIAVKINNPIIAGAFIDFSLFYHDGNGLPVPFNMILTNPTDFDADWVIGLEKPSCLECVTFTPKADMPSGAKLVLKLRVNEFHSSITAALDLAASDTYFRASVKRVLDTNKLVEIVYDYVTPKGMVVAWEHKINPLAYVESAGVLSYPSALYLNQPYGIIVTPTIDLVGLPGVPFSFMYRVDCSLRTQPTLDGALPRSSLAAYPGIYVIQYTDGATVARSSDLCMVYSKFSYTRNNVSKSYLTTHALTQIPALKQGSIIATYNSIVCSTTHVPVFYVAAMQASSTSTTTSTTFKISLPRVYSLAPVSENFYQLKSVPRTSSSDPTNTYILTVTNGRVLALTTILTCPTSGTTDATSQVFSYTVNSDLLSSTMDLSSGYFIFRPLATMNSAYTMTMPDTATSDGFIDLGIALKSSMLADWSFVLQTPASTKQQLFRFVDGAIVALLIPLDDDLDFTYMLVNLSYDPTDKSRLFIKFSRELRLFHKTQHTEASYQPFLINLQVLSPYYNQVVFSTCSPTSCSPATSRSLRVNPPLAYHATLRVELGAPAPSTIIINRDFAVTDTLTLTWNLLDFGIEEDTQIYESYVVYITKTVAEVQLQIQFARLWTSNTPIAFSMFASSAPNVNNPQIKVTGNVDDGTASFDFIIIPDFSNVMAPVTDFYFSNQLREYSDISFTMSLGRNFLYGQQLTLSLLPLSSDKVVSFTALNDPSLSFIVTTGPLKTEEACPTCCQNCVHTTITSSSTKPIPANTPLTWTLSSENVRAVNIEQILVTSSGLGDDGLPLDSFVAYDTTSSPLKLYNSVSVSIAPSIQNMAASNGLCYVGVTCAFNLAFTAPVVGEGQYDMVIFINLRGYSIDLSSAPSISIADVALVDFISTQSLGVSSSQLIFKIASLMDENDLPLVDLNRLRELLISVKLIQETLDGAVDVVIRDVADVGNFKAPDLYTSTRITGPRVYPNAVSPTFFYVNGGAFIGESFAIGYIPQLPLLTVTDPSDTTPSGAKLSYDATTQGGQYTSPIASNPVISTTLYSTTYPRAVGSLLWLEQSSLSQLSLVFTPLSSSYLNAHEPLIAMDASKVFVNTFNPTSIQSTVVSTVDGFTERIPATNVPFIQVRGFRAVRTIPSINWLALHAKTTFNLTITELFTDGVRFLEQDTVYLTIPSTLYDLELTPTRCIVEGTVEQQQAKRIFVTLTPRGTIVNNNHILDLVISTPDGPGLWDINSSKPQYTCPITLTAKAKAISHEDPYCELVFTANSLGTTSSHIFYAPFPLEPPSYKLEFRDVELIDTPGRLLLTLNDAYISNDLTLRVALPFSVSFGSLSDVSFCLDVEKGSVVANVQYYPNSKNIEFSFTSHISSPTVICSFAITPSSAYVHGTGAEYYSVTATTRFMSTSFTVPVIFTRSDGLSSSLEIAAPIPTLSLEANIVTNLATTITISGQQMSLQALDTLSFSLGVYFTEVNGATNVSHLACLSAAGDVVTTVKFTFLGDEGPMFAPSVNASEEGLRGVANRVQLQFQYAINVAQPWRCQLELKTVADSKDRSPDGLLIARAYPAAVELSVANKLTFRPLFDFQLNIPKALSLSPSTTSFFFYYNSTSVELVENTSPPSMTISLPYYFATTPFDGILCQLNGGDVKHLPFFVISQSSQVTSFSVPTERLIVPTYRAVNFVHCLIPQATAEAHATSQYGKFSLGNNLISQGVDLETIYGFQIEYCTLPSRADCVANNDSWIKVSETSTDIIPITVDVPLHMRYSLTHWPRLQHITVSRPEYLTIADGCTVVGEASVGRLSDYVLYRSEVTGTWITLFEEQNTVCYTNMTVTGTITDVSKTFDVSFMLPRTYNAKWTFQPQWAPMCNFTQELSLPEFGNAVHTITDVITNAVIRCRGFSMAPTVIGPVFSSSAHAAIFTNMGINYVNAMGIPTPLYATVPGYGFIPVGVAPTPTPDEIFTIQFISMMTTFDSSGVRFSDIDTLNTTTPYSINFNVGGVSVDMWVNPSLVKLSPAPYAPSVKLSAMPDSVPVPRGKTTQARLSVTDAPQDSLIVYPLWLLTDTDQIRLASADIFTYLTTPYTTSIDTTVGAGAACSAEDAIGSNILALASFNLQVQDFPMENPYVPGTYITIKVGIVTIAIQPTFASILAKFPETAGTSFDCILPLTLIASQGVTFIPAQYMDLQMPGALASIISASASIGVIMPFPTLPVLSSMVTNFAIDAPMMETLYTDSTEGLTENLYSTLLGEYGQTDHQGFILIGIDGTKLYPGDTVVLKFVPNYIPPVNVSDAPQQPPYRLYTPPFLTDPTPCYDSFWPSGLNASGYITALSNAGSAIIGNGGNLFALTVSTSRTGFYQQLLCQSPLITYSQVGVTGSIYGRVYRAAEFQQLRAQIAAGDAQISHTAANVIEMATNPGYLPPVGYISEAVSSSLFVSARPLTAIPTLPRTEFDVQFVVHSSPPQKYVVLHVNMTEYDPSAFIRCTGNFVTRFYSADGFTTDETRGILRIVLPAIYEYDTVITCTFATPSYTPTSYYMKNVQTSADGWFSYTPYFMTDAEIADRPAIDIPVRLYSALAFTHSGTLIDPNTQPYKSVTLSLQSTYVAPMPVVTSSFTFYRDPMSPFIDGSERQAFYQTITQNIAYKISLKHDLYAEFTTSELFITSQKFSPPPRDIKTGQYIGNGSLTLTLAYLGLESAAALNFVTTSQALVQALKPFGGASSLTGVLTQGTFSGSYYPDCAVTLKCGGECEPCPILDECYSHHDCRSNFCFVDSAQSTTTKKTIYIEGTCRSIDSQKSSLYYFSEGDQIDVNAAPNRNVPIIVSTTKLPPGERAVYVDTADVVSHEHLALPPVFAFHNMHNVTVTEIHVGREEVGDNDNDVIIIVDDQDIFTLPSAVPSSNIIVQKVNSAAMTYIPRPALFFIIIFMTLTFF